MTKYLSNILLKRKKHQDSFIKEPTGVVLLDETVSSNDQYSIKLNTKKL